MLPADRPRIISFYPGIGAYSKVEGFAFLPVTAFSMAMSTFISQNRGAGKHDRMRAGARFGLLWSVVIIEIIGLIIFTLAPVLVAAFNRDPEVIAYGMCFLLLPVRLQPYGFRRDARPGETDDADAGNADLLVRGAGAGALHRRTCISQHPAGLLDLSRHMVHELGRGPFVSAPPAPDRRFIARSLISA